MSEYSCVGLPQDEVEKAGLVLCKKYMDVLKHKSDNTMGVILVADNGTVVKSIVGNDFAMIITLLVDALETSVDKRFSADDAAGIYLHLAKHFSEKGVKLMMQMNNEDEGE